jgi:DNA polymerase III delta prime subunit
MMDKNPNHYLWTETYRPKTVAECILPERLKKPFQDYVNKTEIPNLLLHGGAGVGKTTVAKAMCNEINADYLIINGSDETGVDVVRSKIKDFASTMSFTGGRKVIIVDEADYLSTNSQAAFRNVIEEFASNCSFIFTCNFKNKMIEPLHSRCAVVDFTMKTSEKSTMASQFFKRVNNILTEEGVNFEQKVIAEVIKKHFPDFRRVLNELQRYSSNDSKTIDTGILAQIGDITIDEIVGYLKEKNFGAIRKWVASNDIDAANLYRKIYDSLYDVLQPQSIPQAVIILADYQYKQAFVADAEINTVACLTELMVSVEFK